MPNSDSIMLFKPQKRVRLSRRETALLLIDMQYYDAHPDYGICLQARQEGREEEVRHYIEQLERIVPKFVVCRKHSEHRGWK